MANESKFRETAETLFEGINTYLSTKTVVGTPIETKDAVIIPLSDVSFGIGAGAFAKTGKNNSAGGVTGKMSPSALLVIQNGTTRLINLKDQDSVGKVLDMVPGLINRFAAKKNEESAEVEAVAEDFRKQAEEQK